LLPAGGRPYEGRLPLLLLSPTLAGLFEIAPGAAGKAHETPAVHLHAQAALAVGTVEGAERAQHMATFAGERLVVRKANKKKNLWTGFSRRYCVAEFLTFGELMI
jgi:hypothetical protein